MARTITRAQREKRKAEFKAQPFVAYSSRSTIQFSEVDYICLPEKNVAGTCINQYRANLYLAGMEFIRPDRNENDREKDLTVHVDKYEEVMVRKCRVIYGKGVHCVICDKTLTV